MARKTAMGRKTAMARKTARGASLALSPHDRPGSRCPTTGLHRAMMPLPKFLLTSTLALLLGLAGCASDSTLRTRAARAEQTVRISAITSAIAALERLAERDPENFAVQNMLSGYHLKLVKESGNHAYLSRAAGAARASLTALPAEANPGGVAALARAKAATPPGLASAGSAVSEARAAPAACER